MALQDLRGTDEDAAAAGAAEDALAGAAGGVGTTFAGAGEGVGLALTGAWDEEGPAARFAGALVAGALAFVASPQKVMRRLA